MGRLILLLLLLIPTLIRAESEARSSCGSYRMIGKLAIPKDTGNGLRFFINKDTRGELRFEIPDPNDLSKLVSHIDQLIEMTATLKQTVDRMRGKIYDLTNIHLRNSDPLKDVGFVQLRSVKCEPGHSHAE